MNYFKFHIGDYNRSARHLSNEEDLAYRRLLDMYYDTEAPIPLETQWVARRIRVDTEIVEIVLKDMFERTEDGWRHARCDQEIDEYHRKAERNRENGKRGGRPKTVAKKPKENPVGSQSEPSGNLNHKPLTTNHKPDITPLNPPKGDFPCPDGVDPIDWDSLLKVRVQKRAKMTPGAYRAILKKLDKWQAEGWPPGPIVANAVERGWTTVFETDEMKKGSPHGSRKSPAGSDGLSSTTRAAISVFGYDGPNYELNPGRQNGISKPTYGVSDFDGPDWDDGGSPF